MYEIMVTFYCIFYLGGEIMVHQKISILIDEESLEIPVTKALRLTNYTKKELLAEIQTINKIASYLDYPTIICTNRILIIPEIYREKYLDLYFKQKEEWQIYQEEERQLMMILLTFLEDEFYSVFSFQEFFNVSKNTVLSDIKKVRERFSERIQLKYSRRKGFYITGDSLYVRSSIFQVVSKLLKSTNGPRLLLKKLCQFNYSYLIRLRMKFLDIIKKDGLYLVPSRFDEITFFTAVLLEGIKHRKEKVKISQSDIKLLKHLKSYYVSQHFLAEYSESIIEINQEELYFTIVLMTATQGEIQDKPLEFLLECANEMIKDVERLAVVEFQDYRKLLLDLFYHLVPAYFRIKYQIPLSNVLTAEIKEQYSEVFDITLLALKPLERLVGRVIPEDELAYFTILFGGAIRNQESRKIEKRLKAMILCPSGISSSLIMKSELTELFPQIDFSQVKSVEEFSMSESNDMDMIFSTVPIQTNKKLYVISPLMSYIEKNILLRQVQEDFLFSKILIPSVDEVIDALLPYVELKEGITRSKLHQIIQKKIVKKLKRREDTRPMLSELLTRDKIKITDEPLDWKQAIKRTAQPLIQSNMINDSYIDAMIKKVIDYGPFIHIGHGVALPHARPEDGVCELGMSLLKVTTPVNLLDDKKHSINIFICLAAIDNETHLRALSSLTKILSNKELLNELMLSETEDEIYKIILKGENL